MNNGKSKYLEIMENNALAACPEEVQQLIRKLINLPPDDVEKMHKVIELVAHGDNVIPDAVNKLTSGSLTRDQFFDVIENQYRLFEKIKS